MQDAACMMLRECCNVHDATSLACSFARLLAALRAFLFLLVPRPGLLAYLSGVAAKPAIGVHLLVRNAPWTLWSWLVGTKGVLLCRPMFSSACRQPAASTRSAWAGDTANCGLNAAKTPRPCASRQAVATTRTAGLDHS